MPVPPHVACLDTPLGPVTVEGGPAGVGAVRLRTRATPRGSLPAAWAAAVLAAIDGRAADVPLDLRGGTAFRRAVWDTLRAIPFGGLRTYGDLAEALGRPGAARAVGAACGANPLPLLIPCHRVVGAGGRLTGFTGGLDLKRRLLAAEGHRFAA